MMSIASPLFQLPDWLKLPSLSRRSAATDPDESAADATRARQDFMMEMLDRHPESFSTDYSLQSMLSLYRDRF
jgi:hypothetical protein